MSLFKPDALTEADLHEYGDDTDPTLHFSTAMRPMETVATTEIQQPTPLFSSPPQTEEPMAPAHLEPIPETPMMAEQTIMNSSPPTQPITTPSISAEPAMQPYGIEKIIRLIRSSPSQDSELVISIILQTLESAGINTHTLLVDAAAKEDQAQLAIQKLEKEIQFLDAQMNERRQQIESLSILLAEFSLIKGKIEQATHS